MSPDQTDRVEELAERVEELEQENTKLNALLDAQGKKLDRMATLLVGNRDFGYVDVDMVENFLDQLEDHDQHLEDITDDLAAVRAQQKARSDGGAETKVGIARKTTRNELVLAAIKNYDRTVSDGEGMLWSDVRDQAGDRVDLKYQTVKDAWSSLEQEWAAIHVGEGADGNRRVKIDRDEITRELVTVVERDLGRDDLTKELISRKESKGGS